MGRPRIVLQKCNTESETMRLEEEITPSLAIAALKVRSVSDVNVTVVEHQEITRTSNAQVQTLSSYASMVDPEEVMALKFIPTNVISGLHCAKLEIDMSQLKSTIGKVHFCV